MQLLFSATAGADLQRLRAFIAVHDPGAAQRIATALLDAVERLRQFPRLGAVVADLPPEQEVRQFVSGNYVVRYTVRGEAVVILRIWHHFEARR